LRKNTNTNSTMGIVASRGSISFVKKDRGSGFEIPITFKSFYKASDREHTALKRARSGTELNKT
jgi:hypothetical protein